MCLLGLGTAFLMDAAASGPDTLAWRTRGFGEATAGWNEPCFRLLTLTGGDPVTYYNKFQLIAYQVPTDRCFKNNNGSVVKLESRLPPGDRCQIASTQLKDMEQELTAGLSADALRRLMRMIAVAEKAATSLDIDTARNTLKIFMAPEFYFRPELKGATSFSYTLAEKQLIEKALCSVFGAREYESWLFVFGTIVWHRTAASLVDEAPDLLKDVKDDPMLQGLEDTPFLWNAALIMEGGTDRLFTSVKRHYSPADEIDDQYQAVGAAVAKSPLNVLAHRNKAKLRDYLNNLKKESTGDPIFTVGDNLTLGLEICLEHEERVLPVAFKKLQQKYPQIDLQLITACGMRVNESNLCITKSQFVIRVDGAGNVITNYPAPWDYFSEIQQVLGETDAKLPYTSSPYTKDEDSKSKWEKINQIAGEIALQGSLKLNTTDLLLARAKEGDDPLSPIAFYEDAEKACPQKLVIYRALEFAHGVVKGAENKPADYQEPQAAVAAQ